MSQQQVEIGFLIMQAVLALVEDEMKDLEAGDPTRLDLIEFYPRSEDFADRILSCSIAPNDPEEPGGWLDEETTRWPPSRDPQYSPQDRRSYLGEIGGGQGFSRRFTLSLRLFYNELGLARDEAIRHALTITGRIRSAILRDRKYLPGLKDDFGAKMVSWNRAVKKQEIHIAGSAEETYASVKIHLQFEVYYE